MPVRTINLKLQIPRNAEGDKIRTALWTTHDEINKAVASIEKCLLLYHQNDYYTVNEQGEDVLIPAASVSEQALKMARAALERICWIKIYILFVLLSLMIRAIRINPLLIKIETIYLLIVISPPIDLMLTTR